MLKATIEELLNWHPCYKDDEICVLAGGATEFTALDVLKRDDITEKDRLWVVLRPQLIDKRLLRIFACDCAWRVLPVYEACYPGDERPRVAIETARQHVDSEETEEKQRTAYATAASAHATAAEHAAAAAAAAYTTTYDARASYYAAYRAACANYLASYRAAEDIHDADAARAAVEREWQVAHLIEMLEGQYAKQ